MCFLKDFLGRLKLAANFNNNWNSNFTCRIALALADQAANWQTSG